MTDTPRRRTIRAKDLHLVAPASAFVDDREPPLRLGDIVRLNSGGPPMMVVDALPQSPMITVAYRLKALRGCVGKIMEWDIPRPCVHRVRDAW